MSQAEAKEEVNDVKVEDVVDVVSYKVKESNHYQDIVMS